jgi:hypothetical protein
VSGPPVPRDPGETAFRSLAAPGLDEDDLFAALHGLTGRGVFWGEGRPSAFPPAEPPWDDEAERRRRHGEVLGRWRPLPPG